MAANERQAKILAYIDKVHPTLSTMNYYQLLGLGRKARADEVRKSYYRLAGFLHPDLHGTSLASEEKNKLVAVFSRVAEAYQVLSDYKRRKQYDEGLGAGQKRWDAGAAKVAKVDRPEDKIKNPHAKRFYLLAVKSIREKNKTSAILNLKMALSAEPGSAVIKKAIEEAEKL